MRKYYIIYILYVVHTALTWFSSEQKLHIHWSRGLNGVVAVMVVDVMEKRERERERKPPFVEEVTCLSKLYLIDGV